MSFKFSSTSAYFDFNGVVLKAPPWSYTVYYMALLRIDGYYWMIHSDYIGGYGYCIDTTTDMFYPQVGVTNVWKYYRNRWVKQTPAPFSYNNVICPKEDVIWSYTDVKYRRITGIWPGDTYLAGSEAVLASEPSHVPEITLWGRENGNKTSPITLPILIFGRHPLLRHYCYSEVSDGGTLTTEWYINGVLVKTGSSHTGKSYSRYEFLCDTAGTYVIHAVVTNSRDGYPSSSIACEKLTIIVTNDVIEYPNYEYPEEVTTTVPHGYTPYNPPNEDVSTNPSEDDDDGGSTEDPIYGTVGDDDLYDDNDIIFDDPDDTPDNIVVDDITQVITVEDSVGTMSLFLGRHIGGIIRSQLNGISNDGSTS